jgi:hypothetical protein
MEFEAAPARKMNRGGDGGLAKVDPRFDYAANFSSFAYVA